MPTLGGRLRRRSPLNSRDQQNKAPDAGQKDSSMRQPRRASPYKGEQRSFDLPLTQDLISQLAFEAELRNMKIGELVGELIIATLEKDLFHKLLEPKNPDKGIYPPNDARWRRSPRILVPCRRGFRLFSAHLGRPAFGLSNSRAAAASERRRCSNLVRGRPRGHEPRRRLVRQILGGLINPWGIASCPRT